MDPNRYLGQEGELGYKYRADIGGRSQGLDLMGLKEGNSQSTRNQVVLGSYPCALPSKGRGVSLNHICDKMVEDMNDNVESGLEIAKIKLGEGISPTTWRGFNRRSYKNRLTNVLKLKRTAETHYIEECYKKSGI